MDARESWRGYKIGNLELALWELRGAMTARVTERPTRVQTMISILVL